MLNVALISAVGLVFFQNVQSLERAGRIVETNVGLIQGLQADDGDYTMFMGIPYAQIDDTRPFGRSLPQPNFDGIFEAFDESSVCPQRQMNGTILGRRDCLHLNIYVPNTASPEQPLPVMVWIHGGAFTIGNGGRDQFGPKYLVRHDVVLVTINYRLGTYGFMCLNIPEVSGNQGLRDQQTALRWINENIAFFGGDVNKITLFGESAGAMSIDLHLRSPAEKLYRSVIMTSGTSMRGMHLLRHPNPAAPLQIAAQLGYITNDVYEALGFLSTVDALAITDATLRAGLEFRPCVEKYFEELPDQFLTEYPINLQVPKAEGMPILIGYSDHEQIHSWANRDPASFPGLETFYDQLTSLFDFDRNKLDEMEKIVREFYISNEPKTYLQILPLANIASDLNFNYPAERTIKKLLESNVGDLYYYVFSYNGGRNFMKVAQNVNIGGAAHSDILGYLFDMSMFTNVPAEADQLMIDRMTTMWTNFAKYSNPTPETSELLPVQFKKITKDSPYYYTNLNFDMSTGKKPFQYRQAFWDLFYEANAEFEIGYPIGKEN